MFVTYFMIIYSDFVPDVEAKYTMGWVNLVMLMGLILVSALWIMTNQGKIQ